MTVSSGVLIPERVLVQLGCVDCVWKGTPLCPRGFSRSDESTESGYCDELRNFLVELSVDGDSVSAVKEKFMLYVQELQVLRDRSEYVRLCERLRLCEESGVQGRELSELRLAVAQMRLWWERLSATVVTGLGKVAARERRVSDGDVSVVHKIRLEHLHKLVRDSIDVAPVSRVSSSSPSVSLSDSSLSIVDVNASDGDGDK